MAGIGFTLKKLTDKDDLLGVMRAYSHAALASAGPWIFTIIALGSITMFYSNFFAVPQLLNFRIIVVYNFAFSLVLSAPVYMVVTRFLADSIHREDVTATPSVMLGSMWLMFLIQLIPACWFYLAYVELPLGTRLSALANLFLINAIWLMGVYLTALKDFRAVTWSFGIGMAIAVFFSQLFKEPFGDAGMINGFSLGMMFTVFSLSAKIFSEYPYIYDRPFAMKGAFKSYWELGAQGVFYSAGIWVDKWIMWFAPEAWVLPSKMRMYPDYDSAMFLAFLTIIPSMAMFVLSVETNFFIHYRRFYRRILAHAPLEEIRRNHRAITGNIMEAARSFLVVQGIVTFLAVVLAAEIFQALNVNYLQIGIFRLGVLGVFFHALFLYQSILLSYFDNRKPVMYIYVFFFASNALLTWWSMSMGFPYYGYGYFLSALLTFGITSAMLFTHVRDLPYHAFITRNDSVALKRA